MFGRFTQNDISFGSLLLDELRIVIATKHNTDIREGLLNNVCLLLSADERRVFVVGVLLVQSVESVSSDVAGHASAFDPLVGSPFFFV